MSKYLLIGFVVIVVGTLCFIFFGNQKQDSSLNSTANLENSSSSTRPAAEGGNINNSYQGKVIAGTTTPYIEFNQKDYEKALNDGKIVLLNFYADWCPICRAEEPDLISGFNSITNDRVVAFRVNFKDSNTDEYEKNLASQFQIPYQHSKVFLLADTELSRFIAKKWSSQDLINEIKKVSE